MSYSSLCQIYTQKFNADILGVSDRGCLPVFEFIVIHPNIPKFVEHTGTVWNANTLWFKSFEIPDIIQYNITCIFNFRWKRKFLAKG